MESIWEDEETNQGFIEYGFGPNNEYTLAIGSTREGFPAGKNGGATVAIEVEDFNVSVEALKNAGVIFTLEPVETPVCHMAVFMDLDENQLMLHKRK